MTLKLAVLGTCVSDEWYIRQSVRRRLDIDRIPHYQPSTLVSITAPPVDVNLDAVKSLSEWELFSLRTDFDKSFLPELMSVKPDVLLVDLLLDSRQGVISAGNSWVTNSYLLERSGLDDLLAAGTQFTPISQSAAYYEKFRRAASWLADFLADELPNCKVILHRARFAEFYLDENDDLRSMEPWSQNHYFVANLRLDALESIFLDEVPCEVLRVDDLPLFADARHIYGMSAAHYQKSYYAAFTEKLRLITGASYL